MVTYTKMFRTRAASFDDDYIVFVGRDQDNDLDNTPQVCRKFDIINRNEKGDQGMVFKVKERDQEYQEYALKIIPHALKSHRDHRLLAQVLTNAKKEIHILTILMKCGVNNVARIRGTFHESDDTKGGGGGGEKRQHSSSPKYSSICILTDWITQQVLPTDKETCVNIIQAAFYTLYNIHNADVLHLDIKPNNMIYDGYQFQFIDFGISCLKSFCDAGDLARACDDNTSFNSNTSRVCTFYDGKLKDVRDLKQALLRFLPSYVHYVESFGNNLLQIYNEQYQQLTHDNNSSERTTNYDGLHGGKTRLAKLKKKKNVK